MPDTSARLALPLLQPGQSQKEMFHNEALTLLDLAVQASVQAVAVNTPPASPAIGQCWIVGSAPTGDWAGTAGQIAGWTSGGWRFVAPRDGMTVWSLADTLYLRYQAGGWVKGALIGPRLAAIATPAGGTVIDVEARAALAAVLVALRGHGLIAP